MTSGRPADQTRAAGDANQRRRSRRRSVLACEGIDFAIPGQRKHEIENHVLVLEVGDGAVKFLKIVG